MKQESKKTKSEFVKSHPFYNTPLKEKAMWLEMATPYKPRKNRKNFYTIFFNDYNIVEMRELYDNIKFKRKFIDYVKKVYNITYTSDAYEFFRWGRKRKRY